MRINYNQEKLNQILKNLCTLTGINFMLLDTNFHVLSSCTNENLFCSSIQKTSVGKNKCAFSDSSILEKCKKSCSFQSHTCHAGLKDAATPIIKENMIVGYIIMGQLRADLSLSDMRKRLKWLKNEVDIDLMLNYYDNLPVFNEKQICSLNVLLTHILFENAIELDCKDFIGTATTYINNNLEKDLSISHLCDTLHISKNVLYQHFHEKRGCTVNEYIAEQRIKKAQLLLSSTSQPVYQIADAVGIYNYAYFCRLFKKKTGLTPSGYRSHILDAD